MTAVLALAPDKVPFPGVSLQSTREVYLQTARTVINRFLESALAQPEVALLLSA